MNNYQISVLNNNLKLLTIPNKETKIIVLQINMLLGNDIETYSNLETGHFIEHLFSMFTSSKYPDGRKNREYLSFKNIDLDAEIVNKNILFSLEFDKINLNFVLDLVTNALVDFKIDESMFHQEKNAVIEELNEIIKNADYKFETKIDSILFKGHQRSFSQNDRLTNTKKITPNDIQKYYDTYFTTKNFIISLFGNIDTKLYNQFKKNLEYLHKTKKYKYKPYKLNINQPIIYFKNKESISNLKIYFKINAILFDDIFYDLQALNDILLGDLNSLIMNKLRTEKGLVYYCDGDLDLDEINNELSIFCITTLCNTQNLLKVITYILEILSYVKHNLIESKYITSYKSKIRLLKHKNNFTKDYKEVISSYSKYLLWDKEIIKKNKEFKKLESISQQSLKNISNTIFKKENMVICYDGSKKMDSSIKQLFSII